MGLDVFRRNGNEFSQVPTSGDGSWERARTIGDHIVGWDPFVTDRVCDDFRSGGDGWWGQEPPIGLEIRGDDGPGYGWDDLAWDAATTFFPAGKVASVAGQLVKRIVRTRIKESARLVKEAQVAGRSNQEGLDRARQIDGAAPQREHQSWHRYEADRRRIV